MTKCICEWLSMTTVCNVHLKKSWTFLLFSLFFAYNIGSKGDLYTTAVTKMVMGLYYLWTNELLPATLFCVAYSMSHLSKCDLEDNKMQLVCNFLDAIFRCQCHDESCSDFIKFASRFIYDRRLIRNQSTTHENLPNPTHL